jgi:hypothetical protein
VRIGFAVPVFLALACGAPSPAPRARQAGTDPAVELALRLPAHAESCAVARPGLLSDRQRWLAVRLTHAHQAIWLGDLDIVAAAQASALDDVRRDTSVIFLRVAGDVEDARARIERAVPLDGEATPFGPHRYRVEIVGPDTLVIRRGRWTDGLPGAETRCRELARAHPDAFEVASSARLDPLQIPEIDMPQRVDHVIERTASGVVVEQRAFLASPGAAGEDFVSEFDLPLVPDSRAAYWDSAAHVTETRYLWEDLELAREDQTRLAEADRAAREEARPRPLEQIDVSNSAVVRMEIRRWEEAIAAEQGERRAAIARELRRILEAAWIAHPSQTEFASVLYSLLMTELDDAPAAASLAADVMHAAPADEQTWRSNRRAALARVGAAALAPVLVEDGLVRANESARAARDVLEILAQRENYDLAESGWLATRVFESTLAQAPLVPVRPVELGRKALVPTAVALVLGGREPTGLEALYVLARGEPNPAWSPSGTDAAAVARLERGDRVLVVGADVAEVDGSTARLSRHALHALAPGPVTIGIFFVPFHSPDNRASARVVLAGTLDERGLTIERAAWGAGRVAWERVSQYVAGPLESFEPDQVFPPVELAVNAEGTRELELVLEARDSVPDVTCRALELRVECSAAAGPDALYGFIAEVAARVLADDARLILR